MPTSSTSSSPYAQRQRNPRKHLVSIVLVVALHGLLLWALQSGLAQHLVKTTEVKVVAMLLSDNVPPPPAPPPAPTPPPPPPKAPPPPVAAPAPSPTSTTPTITVPAAPPSPAPVTAAPPAPVAPPAPPAHAAPVIKEPGILPGPDPTYPQSSRRLEEEGTVTLKFLIGTDGRVLQAEIEKTSGYKRLDEAALNALSKRKFTPRTVDGKAEQSSASMKYTWRLE